MQVTAVKDMITGVMTLHDAASVTISRAAALTRTLHRQPASSTQGTQSTVTTVTAPPTAYAWITQRWSSGKRFCLLIAVAALLPNANS